MSRGTVAIVGRPNVGKSTLFNRLAGGRQAIVHDRSGITRDRHFGSVEWGGRAFWLVDTGGWTVDPDEISSAVRRQVKLAIDEAEVILFLVDGRVGLHPADEEVGQQLRPAADRVILVANKADQLPEAPPMEELYRLGLGDPQPVSAANGAGTGDLLDLVMERLPEEEEVAETETIQVAVIGRPNVGKSSIMNRLLGKERAIVSSAAGTTRDAIDSPLRYHAKILNFIDTAGLRRRSKVEDEVEFYSTLRTARSIARADVCVLVVDGAEGMLAQDLRIQEMVWEEGSALIVAVNKWDLVTEKSANSTSEFVRQASERVPALGAVPFVFTSALTGQRIRKLLDHILRAAAEREKRIGTAEVNRVLEQLLERKQPPQKAGREVKIFYGSQIGIRPPTFALVVSQPDAVPESYRRFLVNGFRKAWGFEGSPVRVRLKKRSRRA